jgi:hypothetical protein
MMVEGMEISWEYEREYQVGTKNEKPKLGAQSYYNPETICP